MSAREYLHRIRSRLSTPNKSKSLEDKGKNDVELVDITGSCFLLDNIELENELLEDPCDTSTSSGRVSAAHRSRFSRYMKIPPGNKEKDGGVSKGNLFSGTEEDSAPRKAENSESTSFKGVSTEGEMPRYDPSEVAPLRGTNSSEWTHQEDPTGLIAATYSRHKRTLGFILSASMIALAVMAALAATAIILRNKYSTSSISHTLLNESETEGLPINKWILPDVQERKLAMLRMSQNPQKTNKDVKNSDSNGKAEYSVNPTPIIIPIPLFFKSATESEMRDALVVGNDALHKREMTEIELLKKGFTPMKHSPTSYQQYFGKSSAKAKQLSLKGFKMESAYKSISSRMNLSKSETLNGALKLSENNSLPTEWCEPQQVVKCNETTEIYRTYDGSCNNLLHTLWGATNTPFLRILQPSYADGISQLRSLSKDGSLLPNPIEISSKVHLDRYKEDGQASLILPLWGQFVSHDLIMTATSSGRNGTQISCCDSGLPLTVQHPECIPLVYHSKVTNKSQCISITRSAPYPGCELGPRIQFNQVSSFLDASNIYGSAESDLATESLRMNQHGLLKESQSPDGKGLLPIITDPDDDCNNGAEMVQKHFCFKAGDARVNVDTSITSMYTIWMRQHNEIAENLILLNRHWNDEKIFQESRRILTAQIQHITYNEFLPVVLGQEIMNKSGLQLLQDGYYQEYDPQMNPTISNVFSAAAFRFTDSMMQGLIHMIDPTGTNKDFIQLRKLMVNPFLLWTEGKMDALMSGMANTPAAKVDAYFTSQLSQYMSPAGVSNSSEGLDLVALNIQRGRDHGLPSYTAWRKVCGLSSVDDFSQLENDWDDGASLLISNIYKSVKDVDVYTGLLAEKPASGAIVGPTLACLLVDQFLRLKKGDRYWYEGDIQIKPFSSDQLKTIRQTTLARVLCDNGDNLKEIQMKPMLRKSETNPIVNCGMDIPRINYGAWREFPSEPSGKPIQNSTDKSFRDLDEEIWGKEDLKNSTVNKNTANNEQMNENSNHTAEPGNVTQMPKSIIVSKSNENVTNGLKNSTPPTIATLPISKDILGLPSFNLTLKGNGEVMIEWPKSNSSKEE